MLPTAHSNVSERRMEYRFPRSNALLADGEGGFWLGGQTSLVHWHARQLGDVSGPRGFRAWRVVPTDLSGWAYRQVMDLNNSRTVLRNRS